MRQLIIRPRGLPGRTKLIDRKTREELTNITKLTLSAEPDSTVWLVHMVFEDGTEETATGRMLPATPGNRR